MNELNAVLDLLGMLLVDPPTVALLVLLAAAAVIDCRTFRIPNWLTAGGMALGLALHAAGAGTARGGMEAALYGALLGLAIMLPLYLLRIMGAGDVKLMAMAGAFLGPDAIVHAVLATFIVGGASACLLALRRGTLARMLRNVRLIVQGLAWSALGGARLDRVATGGQSVGKLPYGVSIAVGTSAFVVGRHFGFL